ncbi:SRPBCC family protein [Ferruginibacter albus]|uniref:SRPBCC family protein n=1 Tax=Ferruginibacter albus TaxID=2875540 RepID=UPI001CC43D44|nr:SRPBCC domain-containing protein [Ferruginibacter albus]UAY50892.1 SRPBCC domain-containing protein [Ferruginibacter albus]
MESKSLTISIAIEKSETEVFNAIKEVQQWWNSEDFKGSSKELDDEFIIYHPDQHYSEQRLIEVIPDRKIVWLVTESKLYWLENNKEEWTNTKMIFDITTENKKTILHFTHEGLVPEKECYAMCEKGWTMIIKEWLFHFITFGTSSKEMSKAEEIRNRLLEE